HSPANSASATATTLPTVSEAKKETSSSGPRPPALAGGVLVAPVPLPGQPLPSLSQGGYGQSSLADNLIAFDVTYLRQDFSVKLPVASAQPGRDSQRFAILVRPRQVSAEDAQAFRDLTRPAAGELSPYSRAAVGALRRLTGRDVEPNAAAWRQVLVQK